MATSFDFDVAREMDALFGNLRAANARTDSTEPRITQIAKPSTRITHDVLKALDGRVLGERWGGSFFDKWDWIVERISAWADIPEDESDRISCVELDHGDFIAIDGEAVAYTEIAKDRP